MIEKLMFSLTVLVNFRKLHTNIALNGFHSMTFFIKTVLLLILQSINPLTLSK